MVIKPHHFMDIIKLYGGGIQVFVPDTDYGHAGSWAVTKHVRIVFHI